MGRVSRIFLSAMLGVCLVFGVVACGSDTADEPATEEPVAEADEPAEEPTEAQPLPDEQLYKDVLALGLDYSYGLALDDGTYEVLENMEGYGAVSWTDDEGREITVSRRYVEGEPEEWTYSDTERAAEGGVTELSPTGAQLQKWDALAEGVLSATGASGELTRGYAWTSDSGISTFIYATDGMTDDPNLRFNLGVDEALGRFDLTIR